MEIELQQVTKRYGRTLALDRVSCVIPGGRVVVVLGPNGAGKSTLLRCLSTVAGLDGGRILIDKEWLRRDRLDLRRRLMFVPDFPVLNPGWTLIEQMGATLRVYGVQDPGIEERALAAIESLDLLPLARRPLGTLSRGQGYKAALAILFTLDPELWLLDEPFASGMDPLGLRAFREAARAAAARGRTVIYSTQVLEVAERLADQVLLLHEGELRISATMEELRAQQSEAGPLEGLFEALRSG